MLQVSFWSRLFTLIVLVGGLGFMGTFAVAGEGAVAVLEELTLPVVEEAGGDAMLLAEWASKNFFQFSVQWCQLQMPCSPADIPVAENSSWTTTRFINANVPLASAAPTILNVHFTNN